MGLDNVSPWGNTIEPMDLKEWLKKERGRSKALALAIGVPSSFVSKMVSGEKPIPIAHMAAIEAATGKEVTRREMCPDDWAAIWPELAAKETTQEA